MTRIYRIMVIIGVVSIGTILAMIPFNVISEFNVISDSISVILLMVSGGILCGGMHGAFREIEKNE